MKAIRRFTVRTVVPESLGALDELGDRARVRRARERERVEVDALDAGAREVAERFLSNTHSFGPNSRTIMDAISALASTCSSLTTGAPRAR